MNWRPEQTGSAVEDIAIAMEAIVKQIERTERTASPEIIAMMRGNAVWSEMPLVDFITAAKTISAAIFAEVDARTAQAA